MGKITNDMYSKLPNLVFGFHGCRKSTYDAVIVDGEQLKPSENKYDSIRGVFIEGGEVYPGSEFVEKTHIQICIVNPNCIKGYFKPMERNEEFRIP